MHKILVLDANQRSALAVIRSLGRAGLNVIAADSAAAPIGAASKYATGMFRYPDPARDPESFVREVASRTRQLGIDVVVPATDLTTMVLVSQPERLAPARLACPESEAYEALTDKRRLIECARSLGVPVPRTVVASTATEVRAAAGELGFPLVLKPSRSRYLRGQEVIFTAVRTVADAAALEASFTKLDWLADIPCLVQEFIPGYGAGIFASSTPEGPIAWFAHRRLREKPPSGGVSVLSESADLDPRMQDIARQLLAASRWRGVAMIEFRVAPDGTPYLMEVNGRFWGSLQLAIDSGVDFPRLLYQITVGEKPGPVPQYVRGRRLRWLLGDVDNLLLQVKSPNLGASAKLGALGAFLGTCFDFGCRQEVFRWSDPAPGLREARNWIGALGR